MIKKRQQLFFQQNPYNNNFSLNNFYYCYFSFKLELLSPRQLRLFTLINCVGDRLIQQFLKVLFYLILFFPFILAATYVPTAPVTNTAPPITTFSTVSFHSFLALSINSVRVRSSS